MRVLLALLVLGAVIVTIGWFGWFAIGAIFKAFEWWIREHRWSTPLCRDCEFCDFNEVNVENSTCLSPFHERERNLVSGEETPRCKFCRLCRSDDDRRQCGWKGRFFVKREDAA